MKVLFLVPYPLGKAPSQRFRFEQYFNLFEKKGYKYDVKYFLSLNAWHLIYSNKVKSILGYVIIGFVKRFFHLLQCYRYDFVFIHREVTPIGPPIFEWLIAKVLGKKIVYDFDDAIWLNDPIEQGTLRALLKWKKKIPYICKWSHKVSAGNQYLADFAKQYCDNVIINPTTIETEESHNPKLNYIYDNNSKCPVIGWTGTHSTLSYLDELVPTIKKLEKTYKFRFVVIANKNPEYTLSSFEFIQWNKETEIQDLMRIDIGLMPLSNDAWSKGKCGFKLLQYMSLSKPALASPVGVNIDIVEDGINGFVCQSSQEWHLNLEKLLLNASFREKLGANGRKKIINKYSVLSNQANFSSLFGE